MVSSTPRSFSRSGALASRANHNSQSCALLDAALERCGNVPSAVADSATCCEVELAKLKQACWTCTNPESTEADCAAATLEADIAVGMSTCMSRMPPSFSSSSPPTTVGHNQPLLFVRDDNTNTTAPILTDKPAIYKPSTLFLVSFFGAVTLLALGLMSFVLHRCRKARPYEKRAHRRRVLDLMEGFTPTEERKAAEQTPPQNPWVEFQKDDIVSPPPPARSRTPSPPPPVGDMYEVRRPNAKPRTDWRYHSSS